MLRLDQARHNTCGIQHRRTSRYLHLCTGSYRCDFRSPHQHNAIRYFVTGDGDDLSGLDCCYRLLSASAYYGLQPDA